MRSGYIESRFTVLIPGFYCDVAGIVYVDMGEVLRAHGICDTPEIRAVLWSDIESEVFDVPLCEICEFWPAPKSH
jgi:hypothetical protein